jgi:alpha-L-fucosidase
MRLEKFFHTHNFQSRKAKQNKTLPKRFAEYFLETHVPVPNCFMRAEIIKSSSILKFVLSPLFATALFAGINSFAADATPAGAQEPTSEQRMQWWTDARFGMFIHWGIYSVPAHAEWYMNEGHVPRDQYAEYAEQFDPTNFNADQWARIARAAGIKYLVITSKHHDGFSMFNTKATQYNVVDDTPWHTDPLKLLSEACRRHGIRFCVYYSIMDWHSPDQKAANSNPEHPTYNPTSFVPGQKEAYVEYMKAELTELITQYHPAVLWFDGQWMNGWTAQDGQDLYRYLRALDPLLIINDRVKGAGDYETPEQRIPPNGLPGHDWETCMTINNSWGYNADDQHWKSTETLLHNLIDIASKGGNYLLNVGPTSAGVIPQPEVARLRQMGQWLKVNGQAIYGTSASPFKEQLPWGRCTQKATECGTTLYLHVWDWPKDGKLLVPGLKNQVVNAYLLEPNWLGWHKRLKTTSDANGMIISVPQNAPDKISSTIVLKLQGVVQVQ